MEKKTPLYEEHVASGGKIVPFAGYLLPVQYQTGVIAEHNAVRTKCGLFDVSHMGEVILEGADALANLNRLMTNDFTSMEAGRVRYSVMCDENGGALDDLLVYKISDDKYLVVVNASNREKDVRWMRDRIFGECAFADVSDDIAQIAIQGPLAKEIMSELTERLPEKYYSFLDGVRIGGIPALVSRTGYTGEDGYEIYTGTRDAAAVWRSLLEAGKGRLIPCGLGARDTLRLEAAMPLYGHEMDETVKPTETSLGFAVKLDKDFIGRDAIAASMPADRERIGLEVIDRGIARERQTVYLDGEPVGVTTSGTYLPYLHKACAMAVVKASAVGVGDIVTVDVRGHMLRARVVALPFYKR